jgi:hypothetical protein
MGVPGQLPNVDSLGSGGRLAAARWEPVWRLADEVQRDHGGDRVGEMAWATMYALAWLSGHGGEAPLSCRRVPTPDVEALVDELAVCVDRMSRARTKTEYARLVGTADALRFGLGEPGPFWWTPLEDAAGHTQVE